MVTIDKALSALQKLYAQRDTLHKQITAAEKKLVAEAKSAAKAPATAKKPAGKVAGRSAKKTVASAKS